MWYENMKDEKDKYEPPKAMRLDKMSSGSGAECDTGSADADYFCNGYSAIGCTSGIGAGTLCDPGASPPEGGET